MLRANNISQQMMVVGHLHPSALRSIGLNFTGLAGGNPHGRGVPFHLRVLSYDGRKMRYGMRNRLVPHKHTFTLDHRPASRHLPLFTIPIYLL